MPKAFAPIVVLSLAGAVALAGHAAQTQEAAAAASLVVDTKVCDQNGVEVGQMLQTLAF